MKISISIHGYPVGMTKRLIDVDDELLATARQVLGTKTLKDTVNAAMAESVRARRERVRTALDVLAELAKDGGLGDRETAW